MKPPLFGNTPCLSRPELGQFDDRGSSWAWQALTVVGHVGRHLGASIHWIPRREGDDVRILALTKLAGQASVIDKTVDTERPVDFALGCRARDRATDIVSAKIRSQRERLREYKRRRGS